MGDAPGSHGNISSRPATSLWSACTARVASRTEASAPVPSDHEQQPVPDLDIPPKVALTAGSAFKFGFFGALGVFVFYLIVSIILGVVALVLLAAGSFTFLEPYLRR